MKKLVITFLVTLLLVMPLVSAGILGDFFDWIGITGKTTENETNETETTCSDGDGGKDYYVRGSYSLCAADGTCTSPVVCDECLDDITLKECYCVGAEIAEEQYVCPYGCENGACLEEPSPEPEPGVCAASIKISFTQDVYYVGDYGKLTVEVFDSAGNLIPNYPFYASTYYYSSDKWEDSPSLTTNEEGYFESSGEIRESDVRGKMLYKVYTQETESCSKVEGSTEVEFRSKENGVTPPGPEPEPEPRPEVCAGRISINFNKNVYYLEEEFKVEIGIFDSQGNPIPNYPFYIKIYDYEKGMWHTSSQEDRTDGSGYKIHQDKMNVGEPFRFGKNKLKIYTDVGECPIVEDITIIEIKRKEGPEPVPCGMGSCVPEPEPIDVEPINISDGRGFYSCSGCESEGKCYPVGYRKAAQYCDIDKKFVGQRGAGSCDNNFECKSNVCLAGDCLTTGLIQKIIEWLKAFFGIEPKPPIEKGCSKLLLEHSIGDYRYEKSMYGEDEHTQAPLVSEDGEHIGTIKCCAAMYKDKEDTEHGVLFCPYDSKEDVTNSVKWLIAKERNIVFKEYENEKVFGDDEGQIVAWINNAYLIAVGVGPLDERYLPLPEDIANAYLKKYPSEFELTEDDIPDAPPERPWVYCTEEDEKKGEECESQAGARLQTDPHPDKDKNCEVYKGCVLPYEKCESIDDIKEREGCYVGVAEMTGDSSVCKEITSDESRRNKCYVKAAETSKDANICEKITDENIKEMCFELIEVVPWVSCTSEEDILKEECHFIDDFESGLGKWDFSSEGAGSEVVENSNTVLRLVGVERANVHRVWDNYLFKFRFKMIDGSVHVDFRRSEAHTYGAKRYLVALNYVGVYNLNKQVGENWRRLEDLDFRLDDNWHTLEIRCYDDIINVYVDDELVAKHKDTTNTLFSGWVRFEAHTGGVPGMVPELLIDDVEIKLITEEDITYP